MIALMGEKTDKSHGRVYVYGGGVAGMTAAHELAIRGFEVHLYERQEALGPQGMMEMPAVGGLARTQYFALAEEQKLYYHVRKEPGEETLPVDADEELRRAIREKLLGDVKDLNATQVGLPRGQGPKSHDYFPVFWLEYKQADDGSFALTPRSARELREAARSIKLFAKAGYFHTELGTPCDMKILIQSFSDPAQVKLEDGVMVLGGIPTDVDNPAPKERAHGQLALKTQERLKELLGPPLANAVEIYDEKEGGPLHASSWLGLAPVTRDWVRVIAYRRQLPGEHGYRFFPSFYRHVFDTMERIPRYDVTGRAEGGSVLENLVSLPQIGLFGETSAPFLLSWDPPRVGDVLSRAEYGLSHIGNLRITSQDLIQFSLRVMRYLTTCSQRRAAELEGLSWWDYLEGYEPRNGSRLYHYSDAFKRLVRSSSRVLAALDGGHGDARTCGNTYVQLLTEALVPTSRNNCTLDAPTSESWFFHWRKHLEELGVRFFCGELQKLELEGKRLFARVHCPFEPNEEDRLQVHGDEQKVGKPIYFVVATDLLSAEKVTKSLTGGVPEMLRKQVREVAVDKDSPRVVERDPETTHPRNPWDRLQTISGIQFFFEKHVNLFDGYLYWLDAEWGLSAICSHLVWNDRPLDKLSAYQSILSVDIGDWNTPSRRLKKAAWECTPKQLTQEVLHQLRQGLRSRGPDEEPADAVLPDPDWVHIDESLEYSRDKDKPTLLRNKTPYLVPIVGDWRHRPGPEPWDPTPQAPPSELWDSSSPKHLWQAAHGGYPVHHGRLVFAGTWLKTFTRLTTMESANESARHAVNAILDHCSVHQKGRVLRPPRPRSAQGPSASHPYEKGLFPTTPFGDYCRIWNPERNELPDLELLQRQDEKSFLEGRPHPWDTWGLELIPSLLTRVPGSGDAFDTVMRVVGGFGQKVSPQATHGLLAVLRHLRMTLERNRPPQSR
jgi:hypothetical protein